MRVKYRGVLHYRGGRGEHPSWTCIRTRDFRCAFHKRLWIKKFFHGTLGAPFPGVARDFGCAPTGLWVRPSIYTCIPDTKTYSRRRESVEMWISEAE